ncbi:MAG: HDOD domain-containing protein [Gammaproteobacteria bacterium]
MTTIDQEQLLSFVDKMPAFRNSVHRLLQLASNLNAENREIVRVIESDPLMTVKILKVVNSPYYGLSEKISSVPRAVVHLGINSIKNMALVVAAIGVLPKQSRAGLDYRAFLLHSLSCATLCKLLADRLDAPPINSSDYFVAGLLHDFGKIVFAEFVPETYKNVLTIAKEKQLALNHVENEIIGTDHSQTGGWLAEHWKLPQNLVAAIDHHHTVPISILSECLFAANQIEKTLQFGFAGNPVIEPFPLQVRQRFGMDLNDLIDALGDLTAIQSEALAFVD